MSRVAPLAGPTAPRRPRLRAAGASLAWGLALVTLGATGAAAFLGGLTPGPGPTPPADAAAAVARPVVPWATPFDGSRGDVQFVVSYFTDRAQPSILVSGPTTEAVAATIAVPDAAARALADDADFFARLGTSYLVSKGKRPGRSEQLGVAPHAATLHRFKISAPVDRPYRYAVFDGKGFAGPFEVQPPGKTFRAVHVGHTSRAFNPTKGVDQKFPQATLEEIKRAKPAVLLHSGDAFVSIFDAEAMREDSLGAFGEILPNVLTVIAPGNHDIGWPRVAEARLGLYDGLFSYLLHSPYRERTLNFSVEFGGWAFVVVNYSVMTQPEALVRTRAIVEAEIDRRPTTPTVVLWGGSERSLWDVMAQICASRPQVRLVLGGDGGRYERRELAHGAWIVHNAVHKRMFLDFSETGVAIDLSAHGEATPRMTIPAVAPASRPAAPR